MRMRMKCVAKNIPTERKQRLHTHLFNRQSCAAFGPFHQSSDCEIFEVEEKVARMSETVNTMLEQLGNTDDHEPVPLPNVSAHILKLVLKWADHHKDDPKTVEEVEAPEERDTIPEWDAQFFKMMDQGTLFEVILAANYLDMKGLLDLAAETVASQIRGKTPEEIRKQFNIKNDFSPEEYEQIKKENVWVEEGRKEDAK